MATDGKSWICWTYWIDVYDLADTSAEEISCLMVDLK